MNDTPRQNRFRAIFPAIITPASIESKTTSKGKSYLLLTGATVQPRGKEAQVRTVMVFGASATNVGHLLEVGKPVELAIQYDGGTVKVIGEVHEPAAAV